MGFGAAIGLAAIQQGMGMGTAAFNNWLAQQREREARWENFKYNEAAADFADKRTRALYNDLQSPRALLSQYKEAGLSPSLMFSGGGAGGGMTQGAQGSGTNGISPTTYGVNNVEVAQTKLLLSEAEKNEEEAKRLRGENPKGEAEIDNLIEDTKNKRLIGAYQKCKNKIEEINLEIAEATKGNKIQMSQYEEEILNAQVQILEEQINQEVNKTDISDATKEDVIKKIKTEALQAEATLALTRAETKLKNAGVDLTYKQIEDIASTISKRAWDMRTELYDRKMELKQWEIECKKWCVEAGIDVDKMTAQGVGLMTGILATTLTKFPMGTPTTVTGFR